MTKEDLRNILNKPYSRDNWKEVVTFVFPNVSIRQVPADIPVKERNKDLVESFKQLGDVRLNDGKILALFELKLRNNVNILRNRVRLNEIVSETIDQETAHGVLSIFEQGTDDYRFTFSAKETAYSEVDSDFVQKKTDAKRYTYLLGKNESCKTPADRFFDLGNNKAKSDINAIQDAFSVEKLSKQFFKEYKEYYQEFVSYLIDTESYHKSVFKADDKAIRDFVKLLLGRLVFIQFVQKKKWLGVPASAANWHDGDVSFLYNSFKSYKNKALFYSEFLEPLFYEALNKPDRKNDLFNVTGTKVPYLNGGLFEKGQGNTSLVNFPASYFEGLLDFFDRYNFTIDENDPEEHEVGIDPEMLGSIFENLLEDNKDKGAFYTPKEIVHYMCQESLKEYLKTYLDENEAWPAEQQKAEALDMHLSNFVKNKVTDGVLEFDELLAKALRDVKICDPAIGSGAFPMGLLTEIYRCMFVLYHAKPAKVGEVWGMKSWEPNTVKKNIIQNSIYGVDIEKGAVDIARLRFWLSLIIDEPEPHALPNLDYKIVVGNSLVSKLGDDIIDIDWTLNETSHGLFGADLAKQKGDLLKKISKEQKEFFNPDSDKKKLAADIRKLKIDLLITQLELMIGTKGIETKPNGIGKKLVEQTERYLQTLGWKNSIKDLQKLKNKPELPLHFFDWKLDFPEVLNSAITDKYGFDIVIGNPPYGARFTEIDKQFFKNRFKNKDSETESYILFIELGGRLQSNKGALWYIIPSNISTNPSYNNIRKHTLENFSLKMIIDLGSNIFESASVDSCIFAFKNQKIDSSKLRCGKISSRDLAEYELNLFEQKYFLTTPQNIFNFYINTETSDLTEKIQSKASNKLSDFIDFARGIEFGYSSDYVYDSKGRNRKPLIAGRCFNRYELQFDNKFVEVDFSDTSNFKTKAIYENPKIFVRRIGKEIIAYLDTENYYNVCDVYNLLPKSNKIDLYEILGIINSKGINYFFSNFFKNAKELFPKIPIKYLKEVPIKLSKGKISKLSKIVQQRRAEGKDTTSFEQEIDNLVYKLYELSYDEVKVIDPDFELSEDDYSKLKLD